MNYYKRHLGDYARDTKHLTMLEHGAFTLLLDYYYSTCKPIPDERCERIANAHADAERTAVRTVLREFFIETAEGWTNKRADEVIAEFSSKSLKAKASASSRWNANAMRTHSEGNASHKPLAISHKEDIAPVGAKVAKKSPATPLPDDWSIPDEWVKETKAKHPETDWAREGERFAASHKAKGNRYSNWKQAWVTWVTSPYPKTPAAGHQANGSSPGGGRKAL